MTFLRSLVLSKSNRKIYLINPRFQIKFSLYVCLLLFLSSIIYPITIFELMSNFLSFASKNSTTLPQFMAISQNLEDKRNSLIIILTLWQVGFIALAFVVNIFLTHRVAGPLFKLKKFFQAITDGQDNGRLTFRDGDHFPEVATAYNEAMNTLSERHKNDLAYLGEVTAYLNNLSLVVPDDKKAVLGEIITKLDTIQNRFTKD